MSKQSEIFNNDNKNKSEYKRIGAKQYTVEDLISMAGTRGIRNFVVITLITALYVILPMHLITYEFLGEFSDHRCDIPELQNSTWTEEQILNYSIPYNYETNGFSKCEMYARDYSKVRSMDYLHVVNTDEYDRSNISNIIYCQSWHYKDPNIDSGVTEFNLVCERKWLYPSTGSAIMLGTMIGSLCVGYLFDTFGRRLIILLAAPCYLVIGVGCAFASNISIYITLKTLLATVSMAFALGPLTLCFELCSPDQRAIISGYSGLLWSLGYMAVAPITYLVRPWRYLQLALVAPILLQLPNYWLLPESPRWLIIKGRYKEALAVLKTFATSNKRVLPPDAELLEIMQQINCEGKNNNNLDKKKAKSSVIKVKESIKSLTAIIRMKELRPRALIIFYCWMTTTMVYFGMTLNATTFSNNKYLYVFISGLLEIPSAVVVIPPLKRYGRRKTVSFCYIFTGIFIIAAEIYDQCYSEDSNALLMIISLGGKFLISAALGIIFLYTNELFPTEYRAIALGEASSIGRIGSISSPYINNLLNDAASWAPRTVFTVVSILAGILSLLLPETTGVELQDKV